MTARAFYEGQIAGGDGDGLRAIAVLEPSDVRGGVMGGGAVKPRNEPHKPCEQNWGITPLTPQSPKKVGRSRRDHRIHVRARRFRRNRPTFLHRCKGCGVTWVIPQNGVCGNKGIVPYFFKKPSSSDVAIPLTVRKEAKEQTVSF